MLETTDRVLGDTVLTRDVSPIAHAPLIGQKLMELKSLLPPYTGITANAKVGEGE